jgi:molybdate/tungstate transport system substrate-binding protein
VLDPKGKLTVSALRAAHLSSALQSFEVFPEESLVGRLQAGQLDAGFFYANEAHEQRIPAVPLTGVSASATYTVTILRGARNPRGARAFVMFLLSPAGRMILAKHGLTVVSPRRVGSGAGIPPGVR